jgi:hypothetical protein
MNKAGLLRCKQLAMTCKLKEIILYNISKKFRQNEYFSKKTTASSPKRIQRKR